MREIQLSRGNVAIVDNEDYEWLNRWKWYYSAGYIIRPENNTTIYMHRLVMGMLPGLMECDHINGNRADNRKSNLRICNRNQNTWNSPSHVNSTSKCRGVHCASNGKWHVKIQKDGKRYWCGQYSTEEEAIKVRNKKALELYGEYARLNEV